MQSQGVKINIIKPTELYNLLQQGLDYPNLSDPNFLLLLDARSKVAFNESHIITARLAPQEQEDWAMLPYDSELECRSYIVVYDSNTSFENCIEGGYEVFSALYPFLRTQKTIFMPQELDDMLTYPAEIIPGLLFLGNYRHGNAQYIHKDLKIKAYVACCMDPPENESDDRLVCHLPIEDTNDSDISLYLEKAVSFISRNVRAGDPVLVYSDMGISRSTTIIMAYLISEHKNSLQVAYDHVRSCRWSMRPNRAFIKQLSDWEAETFGALITIISDPLF